MKNFVQKHQLLSFFVLTYAIISGAVFPFLYLRPGQPGQPWSLVWFLSAFSPTFSALIVSWVIGGKTEVKRLLSGFARWNVGWH